MDSIAPAQPVVLKNIVNCRNAATAFRMIASRASGEGRERYLEIAASYENTARMLEDLQRQFVADAGTRRR